VNVEDRRAQACLAAYADDVDFEREVIVAVEAATRVKITPEARRAYLDAWGASGCSVAAGLEAALRELGFEVES